MSGSNKTNRLVAVLAGLALGLGPAGARGQKIAETAKLLPDDTVLVAAVENVKELGEKFKKTSLYALYKDPAMQRFVVPAEQKIREKFNEVIARAGKDLNMELPKDLPYPEGRIVAALRLETKVRQVPNMVYDEKEEKMVPRGTRNVSDTTPQVIVWADMGANAQAAKDLIDKLVEKGAEKGLKRRAETIRGQQVFIITGSKEKRKSEGREEEPENPPKAPLKELFRADGATPAPTDAKEGKQPEENFIYMFQGTTLVAGSSLELFGLVLARAAGESMPTLADDADMKGAFRSAGGESDISLYVNAKPLLKMVSEGAGNAEPGPEKGAKMLTTLGVDNITGAAVTLGLAPGAKEDFRLKALVRVKGPKRGIPAMIAGANRSTQPEAVLTAGLTGFLVANHDLGAIIDQTLKMVTQVSGTPIAQLLQASMVSTGGPEGNPPPVDLKAEVLDQLTRPLVLTTRAGREGSEDFLLSVGLRNAQTFDRAFGRVHNQFIAQGKEDARRELRKCNIYLLKEMRGIFGALTGAADDEEAPKADDSPALAVVANTAVFGKLATVEQTIRNLARTDLPGIQTDPMYQHAAAFLPAEASAWIYSNQQAEMASMWKMLKAAAAKTGDGRRRGALPGPMLVVEALREVCDFSALPDYADIKKHFGASVAYLKDIDEGILVEGVYLKSPEAAAKP